MPSAKKKKGDERDESPVRGEEKRYWVAISEDVRSNDNTLKIFTKKRFAKEYISAMLERDDEEKQWKSVKGKNKTTYSCNNGTWTMWNKHVTS
jgi:hypothetical protein